VTSPVVAAAMWILCLVLLVRIRSRRDQSILLAATTIALSMTLNIDAAYFFIDRLLGGTNVAFVVGDGLLAVGVYFLARAILVGVNPQRAASMTRPYAMALIGTLIAMVVLFALIDRGTTSGNFMQEHGDQLAASAYSTVQYLFIGAVMVLTSWHCLRASPKMPAQMNRFGFLVLGVGALLGVLLSALILVFDWSNVFAPAAELGRRLASLYDLLFAAAIVFMSIGLALPPIGRRVSDAMRDRRARVLRAALLPVWERAAGSRYAAGAQAVATEVEKLRRTYIETQDALLRSPELAEGLQPHEHEALNIIDRFFVRR
jgi:hypothetical protein